MSEGIAYGIELLIGVIALPWCVFVTVSIFGIKTQLEVMKMEMGLIKEIREWMKTSRRERNQG